MIVKKIECNSAKSGILYAGNKQDAELIISNNCYGKPNDIASQFLEMQQYNKTTNDKNKTYHVVIGFTEDDIKKLSQIDKEEIVKDFANDLGFKDNQYVAYEHKDGNSPHLHVLGNRVSNDGKIVSLSNNYYKHENFCRNQEIKYGLTRVKTKDRTKPYEKIQTLGNHRKIELKEIIDETIKDSSSIDEFSLKMKEKGIEVKLGRGISYIDKDKVAFKGSSIGRDYSLSKTKKKIQNEKNLDNQIEY